MREFHVGFTGSRTGCTVGQFNQLRTYMQRYGLQLEEDLIRPVLHHGDCIGADEAAHVSADEMNWIIEVHPGLDSDGRRSHAANMVDELPKRVRAVHEPAPYLQRNMDIVTLTSLLLAVPDGPEKRRSGTWSTVRAAEKMGRPVVLFMPDGSMEQRGLEDHGH